MMPEIEFTHGAVLIDGVPQRASPRGFICLTTPSGLDLLLSTTDIVAVCGDADGSQVTLRVDIDPFLATQTPQQVAALIAAADGAP